jgi:hypothetical protein
MTTKTGMTTVAPPAAAPASGAGAVKAKRFLKAGDVSRAICPHCKAMRDTVYQYRQVLLGKAKVPVPNVLVGVCRTCDRTISLPAQSTPRIKQARERDIKEQNARIPLELEDRLNMMAYSLDIRPEPFKGAVCRYALSRVVKDKRFAQRVWKNAVSEVPSGIFAATGGQGCRTGRGNRRPFNNPARGDPYGGRDACCAQGTCCHGTRPSPARRRQRVLVSESAYQSQTPLSQVDGGVFVSRS